MDFLVTLIPLFPALAALAIGIGVFAGTLSGAAREPVTARLACWSVYLSTVLCLFLLLSGGDDPAGRFVAGTWLASGDFVVEISFHSDGPGLLLGALFSLLFVVVFRFSRNYLHSEQGFHRFFLFLTLFAASTYLLLLSATAVGTFFGWELAGLCSFFLIAFAWHRHNASSNACRVFVTNRIGDAFFLLGILLSQHWLGSVDWQAIVAAPAVLAQAQVDLIALCFIAAALVKSAQFPVSWWLNRSMEGPTPSSAVFYGAVMVHAGVFLLLLLAPLISASAVAGGCLVAVGVLTFLYATLCTQTQVDIKSSLGYATAAQLGLMFIECGLGLWTLALLHLAAHAVMRSYLYLSAPSILHNVHGNPVQPVTLIHPVMRWLSMASLHNFWLEERLHKLLVRPCRSLARDLSGLDDHLIDPLMGIPTSAMSSGADLAYREEQKIGARLESPDNDFSSGSGLAGKLTAAVAGLTGWFEHIFVLRGVERDLPEAGRRLGLMADRLEQLLLRPRSLVLFIVVSLLFAM